MGVSGQRDIPAALTPGKRPVTHCTEGWMGPKVGVEGWGKFRCASIPGPSSPKRIIWAGCCPN